MANKEEVFFAFSEWEKLFKQWHDNYEKYKYKKQLVISTHEYTSGYWIEKLGKKINPAIEYVYKGGEVFELEKRVREAVEGKPNYTGGLVI